MFVSQSSLVHRVDQNLSSLSCSRRSIRESLGMMKSKTGCKKQGRPMPEVAFQDASSGYCEDTSGRLEATT